MQHLACIMDGNRRYARKQGWQPWLGHRHGVHVAQMVIDVCLHNSIKFLSLYLFSLENFKRTPKEQEYLFSLLVEQAERQLDDLVKRNIRVEFVGDRRLFPQSVQSSCAVIEQATAQGTALHIQLLFCYGGQQEIVAAVRAIADEVKQGTIITDTIDEAVVARYLWTKNVPAPDLIVRTGGAQRISNFLLYQSAYSEYAFTHTLWPELSRDELQSMVDQFKQRNRNFGV